MPYSRNILGIIIVVVASAVGQVTVPEDTTVEDATIIATPDDTTVEGTTIITTPERITIVNPTTAPTVCDPDCPDNSICDLDDQLCKCDFGFISIHNNNTAPCRQPFCNETCVGAGQTCLKNESCVCDVDNSYELQGGVCTLVCPVCDENAICYDPVEKCECRPGYDFNGTGCVETTAFTETSQEPTDSTMVTETTAQTKESTTIIDPTTAPPVCDPDCPNNSTCDLDDLLCKCDFGFISIHNNNTAPCRQPFCNETCVGAGQTCLPDESCVCDVDNNYELQGGVCTLVCPVCDENAICYDPVEKCVCRSGYYDVDGKGCVDINECEDEQPAKCPNGIQSALDCVNTVGSYECDCKTDGYYYDATNDECLESLETCVELDCGEYSICGPDGECVCNRGYEKDGQGQCKDIDECRDECVDATELCRNSPGSFSCDCIDGYRRADSGCEQISCENTTISCEDDQFASLCVSTDQVIEFPTTPAGYTAYTVNTCQENTVNAGRPFGSRPCTLGGVWETPTWLSECDISIMEIATEDITDENREETSSNLEILTSEPEELNEEDIDATTEVIVEVTSAENLTTSVADSVVTTISNLMESPSIEDYSDSSELIVQLDTVAEKVELSSNSSATRSIRNTDMVSTYTSISGDVGLLVSDNKTGFGVAVLRRPDTGEGFRSDQIVLIGEPISAGSFIDGNRVQASMFIPGEAAAKGSRSWIVVYRNSILFRRNTNTSASRVESDTTVVSNEAELADNMILSANVLTETSITGLSRENITFSLPVLEITDKTPVCAYWLEHVTDWSPDGCTVSDESTNGSLICTCNHLTNFASLFDTTSVVTSIYALDIITSVGCSISSVALIAVIFIYTFCAPLSWRGERYHASFLLVSLSVSLLGMNITLLVSQLPALSDPAVTDVDSASCITIAMLLHLFMLSSCAWMNCDAVVLGIDVVKPFYSKNNVESKRLLLWSILWAVVMPLLFVGISAAVNTDNYVYGHDPETDNSVTCWMDPEKVLYLAIIPTALMIFFNLAVYIVLTYYLCTTKESEHGTYWKSTRQSQKRRLLTNFTIVFNLGVSLVFGFLMVAARNENTFIAFAYILTISTSLQGLFILIITVLRNDDVGNSISGRFSSVTDRVARDPSQYYAETIRNANSAYSNPTFTGPNNPYTGETEDEHYYYSIDDWGDR